MRRLMVFISVIILLSYATFAFASEDTPVAPIEKGLASYKNAGPRAAVEAWLSGSSLEGSKDAMGQANSFRQIEEFYGKYENYEIIKSYKLTDRISIVFLVINYQNGPLYTRFEVYKNSKGKWVINNFDFHTKITEVFPVDIILGR